MHPNPYLPQAAPPPARNSQEASMRTAVHSERSAIHPEGPKIMSIESWVDDLCDRLFENGLGSALEIDPSGIALSVERMVNDGGDKWVVRAISAENANRSPGFDAWMDVYQDHWLPAQVLSEGNGRVRTVAVQVVFNADVCERQDFADGLVATAGLARRIRHVLEFPPRSGESGEYVLGYIDMLRTLADAAFPSPPVPESLVPFVSRLSDWFWATDEIDGARMYHGPDAGLDLDSTADEFFAFARGGHGMQSNFLMFELNYNTSRFWDRIGFGNMYNAEDEHEKAREWITGLRDFTRRRELQSGQTMVIDGGQPRKRIWIAQPEPFARMFEVHCDGDGNVLEVTGDERTLMDVGRAIEEHDDADGPSLLALIRWFDSDEGWQVIGMSSEDEAAWGAAPVRVRRRPAGFDKFLRQADQA